MIARRTKPIAALFAALLIAGVGCLQSAGAQSRAGKGQAAGKGDILWDILLY